MVYQMCREMWGRESKGKGVGRGSVSSTGRQQLEDMQALQAHMRPPVGGRRVSRTEKMHKG